LRPDSKWGLWWTKRHWGRFSPSTSVSPVNHSTNFSIIIITRGWHNRPISGRSAEWTQLDSISPLKCCHLLSIIFDCSLSKLPQFIPSADLGSSLYSLGADSTENTVLIVIVKNAMIFACLLVVAGTCLPSCFLSMNVYSVSVIPAFRRHVTIRLLTFRTLSIVHRWDQSGDRN
jgi:hypothetical protein